MGPDYIPNVVLNTCAEQIIPGLCTNFQYLLDSGTLSTDRLNASITPVFKKGDRYLMDYCPVSLINVSSKVLDIICSNMLKHFEKHSVLTSLNHGFRSGFFNRDTTSAYFGWPYEIIW